MASNNIVHDGDGAELEALVWMKSHCPGCGAIVRNTHPTTPRHATHTQHNTTLRNTTQHDTTQHNTTEQNRTQHWTTDHTTTQHNTTQQNTTQHNTTPNTTQHNTYGLLVVDDGCTCARSQPEYELRSRIEYCGLWMTDLGLRIADYGCAHGRRWRLGVALTKKHHTKNKNTPTAHPNSHVRL